MKKRSNNMKSRFVDTIKDSRAVDACHLFLVNLAAFSEEFSSEVINDIVAYCRCAIFKKNEVLWDYGDVCNYKLYCTKGLVASLQMTEKGEVYSRFMAEGDVVIAVNSFYGQVESTEKLIALEDTECIGIHVDDVKMLQKKHMSFAEAEVKRTENLLLDNNNYNRAMRKLPREKYHHLIAQYPYLTERVDRSMIASFMNITPVQLDKIIG